MCELIGSPSSAGLSGDVAMNEQGVFTPYWTKNDSGAVELSTWKIKPEQEYYSAPLKSGMATITSPYLTNTKLLVTSVSVPVRVGGKVVGLAGVDIRLDDLTNALNSMRPFNGGRVMLLARDGNWLANPDKSKLMTAYGDAGADQVKQALGDGEMQVIRGLPDGAVRLVYPFTAPEMNTTWAVVLDIPGETFTLPVWQQLQTTIIAGALILIAAMLVIYFASRSLVGRPLGSVLASVRSMAAGDYSNAISGSVRADELGTVTKALDTFRIKLAKAEQDKLEQEKLEKEIETERSQQIELDSSKAKDLREFVVSVQNGLNRLAAGDLTARMTDKIAPEFESIRENFNTSVGELERTFSGIVQSIGTIHSGLNEISSASNDLARRTEQQAASLEETVAALGDVSEV